VLTPLVVPAHVYEDADRRHLKGRDDNLDPVVSGPWKAGKYVPNEQLSLIPNPNFSGPDEDRAQLDRVIFRVLPEAATRVQALRSGEVDLVGRLTVDDLGILDDTQARIVRRGWRNIDTIAWNHTDPRFASSDVRRALSMALDVDKMIGGVMTASDGTAYARRATGIFPPALGLELPDVTPLPHDPDGARALLAAAGWTDSDGDGLLDKDGEPFSFELLVAVGHKHRKDVAIYVQRDLREVGVDVRIQQLEGRTYGQHVLGRTYEAAMVGWTAGLHPDPTGLLRSDPEDGVRETNYVGYRNPEVDALIEEALAQLDPAEAAQRWSRLMGMVYADQPYTFLWWRDELTGIDPAFTDIGSNLQGTFRDLARWRIDHDR
jgi:peptide/nickel transport system substrate-binding protein